MKKLITLTTAAMLSLTFSLVAYGEVKVKVGKETLPITKSENVEGTIFVPFRAVTESLGYKVTWIPEFKIISVGDVFAHQVGTSFVIMQDGTIKDIKKDSYIDTNGDTMVSARLFAEALGYTVRWDGKTETVNLTK
ncbi:MAG: copper amine oxidase N-terminal domain-containing protein [Lachnospirales bacterium]